MSNENEIEHYAISFAEEIRKKFAEDVRAAAGGLAKSHGLDSAVVEITLWQGISEDLGSDDPEAHYITQ